MNNYHIYEAIGNGKHSAVYKGRKKKTIEYYAIKSVDKSQRPKVLREVRMLHPLNHPNILKFFAWYETNAHLWLILEYCVGGDLRKLLDTDGKLHESSVHDLGLNLVSALQYLHSEGVIFCDLKPSNILMDEFGRVKLCDFGLARRLSDIDKNSPLEGTPYYMAPELFQEGGTHSDASDFWALGCILYECYTGKPPFYQRELTKLVNSIIYDPAPPLPDSPSDSFQNLINGLLNKDPNERLNWPDICNHSFWKVKLDSFMPKSDNSLTRTVSSERNIKGKNPVTKDENTPSKGKNVTKDENTPSKVGITINTPTKSNTQTRREKITTKPSNPKPAVNILRISRAAKLNLQREKGKENYRAAMNTENEAEVRIENKDMELNFSENVPEEEDESDDADVAENEKPGSDESPQPQNGNNTEQNESIDILTTETSSEISDDLSATPPPHPPAGGSTPRKGERVISQPNPNPNPESSKHPSSVFWHASDLSVKPVMPGRKSATSSDNLLLPFELIPAGDYVKLSQDKLDALNARIVRVLSGTSQVSEKQNILKYLELLSSNSEASNILINGQIMSSLVKILRLSKSGILRVQVATLVGLLIRHCTVIEANSGIVSALTSGLRDKVDRLRRFCMASLGELLFYISTQSDQDGGSGATWQVPSSLIALVCSMLGKGEDDLAQLYALRTIDNISTQGSDWTSRFCSNDTISNLVRIYKSATKQESTRLVAGSCLVRLSRFSPNCVQFVFDKLSFKEIVNTVLKGDSKEQQIALNLVNLGFVNCNYVQNLGRQLVLLSEEKQMIQGVISVLEQGNEVLRGKTLIFCGLLCKNSKRWLLQFICNAKFLSAIDRLGKENCEFVRNCCKCFVDLIVNLIPSIIETIFGEIQVLIGGKRPQLGFRVQNPKNTMNLFPLILHLLSSFSFKDRVVSSHVLGQLADLTKLFETNFPGRDDIQITLLRILESISEEPKFILNYNKIFTSQILPSLCILYKGNKDDDARFLCLKIVMDIMDIICNDKQLATESETDLKTISQTLFLPLYPIMVREEDPIPLYAQKLLVMLIEFGYVKVEEILHLRTVEQCFRFLDADLANVNVSNVKLCLALVSAREMDVRILCELKVVRKIGNLLEFLMSKNMEEFLDPTLGLCKSFVLCSVGRNKGERILNEPKLLCDNNSFGLEKEYNVKDIGDFGMNVGMFLDLCVSSDLEIADVASSCVVLLVRAAPRDGTIGILTNLPKIGCVLRDLNERRFKLGLLRVIYALGFACKQYLYNGMILSIPVPVLVQVENYVLGLRKSDFTDVRNAASYLGGELERLPRCA
ncbi:hypothetical protein LUZ60_012266 [Juncus effusus]|nr:hypothetical protein LUZ60_012266 [Juncus effusus]